MAKEFTMPKLGHLMEEGVVVSWKKQVGDKVSKGDILLEIESDKGIMEAECDTTGTIAKLIASEGETVAVGTPIAEIDEA